MNATDLAARLTFAPTRAWRVALRRALATRSPRARRATSRQRVLRGLSRRARPAPSAGMPATDYMRRAYRCSNLARGAGLTTIDRGADPRVGPTCFAPAIPAEADTCDAVTRAAA